MAVWLSSVGTRNAFVYMKILVCITTLFIIYTILKMRSHIRLI